MKTNVHPASDRFVYVQIRYEDGRFIVTDMRERQRRYKSLAAAIECARWWEEELVTAVDNA